MKTKKLASDLTIVDLALDGKSFQDLVKLFGKKNDWTKEQVNQALVKYNGDFKLFCKENSVLGE